MSTTSPPSDSGASSRRGTTTGIRRTRPSYSCEQCRRRRVGCDRVHPTCSACSKTGSACVYPTPLKRKDHASEDSEHKSSRRRTGKMVRDASHAKGGYLSLQSGGRSRFIENTFWATIDPEALDLDSLIFELPLVPVETEVENEEYIDDTPSGQSPLPFFSTQPVARAKNDCRHLRMILSHLPAQSTCDDLYRSFVCHVHPLIALVHTPTFDNQYRRFWEWYQSWNGISSPTGILAEIPSFLPLLFAVLWTGLVAGQDLVIESPPASHGPSLDKKLCALTTKALSMVGFPQNPSMASLEAFLLLQSFQIKEEESLSSCSFVAIALRIAQAMGLHRDPADFGLSPIQCEERRRTWRYLMHLDVMTSVVSGLPMSLNTAITTTGYISELRDELIGQPQLAAAIDDRDRLYPGYVLATGRYEVSSCIREVLNLHLSPHSYDMEEIEEAKKRLNDLKDRIEERIHLLSDLSSADSWNTNAMINGNPVPLPFAANDNAFLSWAIDLLRMQVDRAYGLLYIPMIHNHDLWSQLRAEAIPYFQSYLRTFAKMINNVSFKPFHWLYPGSYQPLNQVCMLLVDMLRRPDAPEVPQSRLALEPIFQCLGPNGRVFGRNSSSGLGASNRRFSNGARVAWARLEALRRKVWKVLGIDATVMWSATYDNRTNSVYTSSPESQLKSDMLASADGFSASNMADLTGLGMSPNSLSQSLPSAFSNGSPGSLDLDPALALDSFSWAAGPTNDDMLMWQYLGFGSDMAFESNGAGNWDPEALNSLFVGNVNSGVNSQKGL
ncbi:hypothetical protein BT63DRAFT_429017 [Microthyrium microscopicum]|uniref:Zn(2)-C6 fungal-type domain-containing protein n=1 Tax=Microthyrium microscopicum TaxID=703497 RepID=A0A6A6U076_9PEZI|nr:hypothetical protein BT63DRAFT_429017 [Microthyrium microscopicum]